MSAAGDALAPAAQPVSALRWAVLGLAALTIFSSYYEADAIGPIADLLLRQRGLTQGRIGELTAVISLPTIPLAILNGILIDRYGPARITLWAALIGLAGAVLTAIGEPYHIMWAGRFVFGISEGTIFIALIAGLAQWFPRSGIALATSVFLSLARVGSSAADYSTTLARPLYEAGWQPPLWLGAAITAIGLAAALTYRLIDRQRAAALPIAQPPERIRWSDLWTFDASYWYILGLHVLYAAVFFPFRQTFAIEYLQHVKGLTLQQAGNVNGVVFTCAVFATPLFGLLTDRIGHRALMMGVGTVLLPATLMVLGLTHLDAWVSTALMGLSFSLVPAIIWPSTTLIVEPHRLGSALGVITMLQALGLWGSNRIAGALAEQSGAGPMNPAGYDVMLEFFGVVSLGALVCVGLLWRRERGPHGHGLELARTQMDARARQRSGGP